MDPKTIRVLSIEDNPGDARLIQVMLFDARSLGWDMPRFELEQVGRLEAGLARLEDAGAGGGTRVDVVLTDLDLPDSQAGDTFVTLHTHFPHMPIVVLTGREDEALAVNTVRAGAEDYLYKREMSGTLLAHALSYAIERQRAKDALQRAHDKLEERVKARTAELAQANEQLQHELEGRKSAEEALLASNARTTEILESINDAFFALDDDLTVTYFNQAAERLLGRDRAAVLGRMLFDAFPEAQGSIFEKRYRQAIRDKQTMNFETYFNAGPYDGWYAVSVYPQENGISVYFQAITERKQAELALRESEVRFRSIFESVNDAIWILDLEGNLMQVNAVACELLGYTREEMITKRITDFLPPQDAADLPARLAYIKDHGQAMFEVVYLRKDGERLPVEVNVRMTDFGGEQVLLSVIRDITARKRAEERLAYLNAVLRAIRNVNQLITQEADRDRLLQRACENLVETLGFHNAWIALVEDGRGVSAIYASGFDDGFAPMTRWLQHHGLPHCGAMTLTQATVTVITAPTEACADCPLARDYRSRGGVVVRLAYRNEVYGILTVSVPMRFVQDTEVHDLMREVAEDIAFALWKLETEAARRRAEEALRHSERELQLTLDATTDGIWKWNFKTNELFFSPRYYTMLGYEPDEFPATYENWAGLIHPEDRPAALAASEGYLETKPDIYRNEFRMRTKDGGYRWIQTVAKVVEWDEHGGAVRMIGHHRDVTARKRAERALEELKERDAALRQCAAGQRVSEESP